MLILMERTTILLLFSIFYGESVIVSTSYGKLNGAVVDSEDGNTKYMFKNIPFATPPIDELRFELPLPPKPWDGIRDATRYSAGCPMRPNVVTEVPDNMSEDCLYLNIFTSKKCMNSSCSVIIYYHGGGFNLDSAVMFNDSFILERYVQEDIVFVIPAYRIGVLGLFYLADEEIIHQNLPIYDCLLSLNFVHNEISNFGGNPDDVHLMGHSAGGTVALLFGSSPLIDPDHKLFKKIIVFSTPQIYGRPELFLENSYEIARRVGCFPVNNTTFISKHYIINCMKRVKVNKLMEAQYSMETESVYFWHLIQGMPFMKPMETNQQFINNVVPRKMLIGVTVDEVGNHRQAKENPTIAGGFWDFENPFDVAMHFQKFQMGTLDRYPQAFADSIFVPTALYSAAMVKNGGQVYLLQSNQQPNSTHVSDMQYFIGYHREEEHTPDMDILDSFYSKMIVNFTKYGEPSPNWKPLDPSKMNYYAVEVDTKRGIWPKMEEHFKEWDVNFWLINMTAYDREVTKQKADMYFLKSTELPPVVIRFTELKLLEFVFQQWYFYGFLVLFAITIAFIVYFLPNRNGYEAIPTRRS